MKTFTTATFENGHFKPDQPFDLPERSRVRLIVEMIPEPAVARLAAWASLYRRFRERPIRSGGRHLARDELLERATRRSLSCGGPVLWPACLSSGGGPTSTARGRGG